MCSQLLELLGRHPGDASDHLLFLGCLNGSWSGSNIQCGPDFVPLVNTLDTQEYNSNIHLRNIKKVAEYSLCMLHNFTTCLLLCAIAQMSICFHEHVYSHNLLSSTRSKKKKKSLAFTFFTSAFYLPAHEFVDIKHLFAYQKRLLFYKALFCFKLSQNNIYSEKCYTIELN